MNAGAIPKPAIHYSVDEILKTPAARFIKDDVMWNVNKSKSYARRSEHPVKHYVLCKYDTYTMAVLIVLAASRTA